MTVFLSFKMLWYLLVSDSSYLINQSIFLKLFLVGPSLAFGELPSAVISEKGGSVYWRMRHFGQDGGVPAGYNFHCWRSQTLSIHFLIWRRQNQG